MWALFKDGEQLSKSHPIKAAAVMEAFERGLVLRFSADFTGDKSGECLPDGYEIKEVPQLKQPED